MNHDGKTQFHVGYCTDVPRNGFPYTANAVQLTLKKIENKGFI